MAEQARELRQELKYAINYKEYACLQPVLASLASRDVHAGAQGEYHIRSLYFDNVTNAAYHEKESGVFQRAKYRIRIYNHSDSRISLELKEKFGFSTAKSSQAISRAIYGKIMTGSLRFSDVEGSPLLTDFYLKMKLEGLRPAVIVDYVREPFVCPAGNVRITFDKVLQTPINSLDLFAPAQIIVPAFTYGSLILEVKYDDFLPRHIQRSLQLSSHQKLAISKYTICRDTKDALDWKERLL